MRLSRGLGLPVRTMGPETAAVGPGASVASWTVAPGILGAELDSGDRVPLQREVPPPVRRTPAGPGPRVPGSSHALVMVL